MRFSLSARDRLSMRSQSTCPLQRRESLSSRVNLPESCQIYVQRPATAMADQEGHRTEDETLPHHGEHELHAVADTVAKAVASSMQEALQPLLRLIPSALATPPSTATTGDKSKKVPPSDDSPGTSGKCLPSRRRSALARYIIRVGPRIYR